MSRIGRKPIIIPKDVKVKIENDRVIVNGPKGELEQSLPSQIGLTQRENEGDQELVVKPKKNSKDNRAMWGLIRSLIANMIMGVTEGFEKKLSIEGVGYRAVLQGNKLILNLGFSHPIEIEAPEGISFVVEKNIITVSGMDKQLVGQIAAKIRDQRKPEPYKGKGIRYIDEVVRRKAGKKAVGGEV